MFYFDFQPLDFGIYFESDCRYAYVCVNRTYVSLFRINFGYK